MSGLVYFAVCVCYVLIGMGGASLYYWWKRPEDEPGSTSYPYPLRPDTRPDRQAGGDTKSH